MYEEDDVLTIFQNATYLRKYLKELARSQRQLQRKEKGSANRLKSKKKLQKIYWL